MNPPSWKLTILRWVAWIGLTAGVLFLAFLLITTILTMAPFLPGMLLYALAAIGLAILVIWLEYYLRIGERKGLLIIRITRILTIEAGIYLAVLLLVAQQVALTHELRGLVYPYSLDYGEGQVLDQVNHLAHFQSIYFTSPATQAPPYTIANYPPLYPLVQAPFVWIFGPAFWYGRLISLLGVFGGAIFIALIIHTLTGNWIAGVIGGLVTLCMPPIYGWAPLVRVDQLAFGLSLAGLFVVVRLPKGWGGLIAASALLVAAAYTKQSYALTAPLAAFAWLINRRNYRRAFLLAGIVGGVGVVIFALLMLATRGSFYFNIVTATQSSFSWDTVRYYLVDQVWKYLPMMVVGCGLFLLIGVWGKIRPRTWALVSAYLVGAIIEAITIGKNGSNFNYLYELAAAFGLVAGAFIAWPGERFRWARPILAILAASQIGAMTNWYANDYPWFATRFDQQAGLAALAKIVRDAHGPVLADETMGLIPLAGQIVYMQPFEFKQLYDAGIWDDQAVATDIANKIFPDILILQSKEWDSFGNRWTPHMREAILANYQVSADYADILVYTPRK